MPPKRNQPTPERRSQVKALAGFGLRQEEICAIVGLRSPKTLRRHYRGELAAGVAEATTKVRQTAFQLAMSGRDPRSTIFWLRTRGCWSRQMDIEERIVEEFVIEDYPIPPSMIQQVQRDLGLSVSPKPADAIDAA